MADFNIVKEFSGVTEAVAPERTTVNNLKMKMELAPGEIRLQDRPILVQRGADFGMPQAPLRPLNTDGTSVGNRRVDVNGVIKVKSTALPKGPLPPPNANHTAKLAPPRVVDPASVPEPPPYSTDPNVEVTPEDLMHAQMAAEAAAAEAPAPVYAAPVSAPAPAKVKGKMRRVVMTGGGLPMKITCSYAEVIISDSVIVLVCVNDGESSIVEPPVTTSQMPPLNLLIDEQAYSCLGIGSSFERDGLLYFVLPRDN